MIAFKIRTLKDGVWLWRSDRLIEALIKNEKINELFYCLYLYFILTIPWLNDFVARCFNYLFVLGSAVCLLFLYGVNKRIDSKDFIKRMSCFFCLFFPRFLIIHFVWLLFFIIIGNKYFDYYGNLIFVHFVTQVYFVYWTRKNLLKLSIQ